MNEIIDAIQQQTPIEIALGIDSQGRTTAKRLYEFLELDKSHYSRWCKKNIINNQFAEENTDYWAFAMNGEWGGQATTDYKLTASFAKKLAMVSGSERGEEAREYFLRTETALKDVAIKRDAELLQMKAAYFDMRMLLENSQREVDKLRKQFKLLESRQNEADNQKFEKSYENRIAKEFLNILDEYLASDENSFVIKPKGRYGSLEVIGIYDDTYIYLLKNWAYEAYEYFANEPVKAQILWNILYQTGYADAAYDPGKKIAVGWKNKSCIPLYRNKTGFLIKNKQ